MSRIGKIPIEVSKDVKINVETGKPQKYIINLGFVGTIEAFLQSFSLTVSPPEVAKVQYSFVFSGVTPP